MIASAGDARSAGSEGRHVAAVTAPLRIVNPPPGGTYLRDPTLPAAFQTLPLRAVGDGAARTVTWSVDGRELGTARVDASLDWPLAIGPHAIAARDERGRTHETRIVVR
jgi:membrane carboxypeptidase/penicillin-binding protein PbpC